jgi:hypothetical protein
MANLELALSPAIKIEVIGNAAVWTVDGAGSRFWILGALLHHLELAVIGLKQKSLRDLNKFVLL